MFNDIFEKTSNHINEDDIFYKSLFPEKTSFSSDEVEYFGFNIFNNEYNINNKIGENILITSTHPYVAQGENFFKNKNNDTQSSLNNKSTSNIGNNSFIDDLKMLDYNYNNNINNKTPPLCYSNQTEILHNSFNRSNMTNIKSSFYLENNNLTSENSENKKSNSNSAETENLAYSTIKNILFNKTNLIQGEPDIDNLKNKKIDDFINYYKAHNCLHNRNKIINYKRIQAKNNLLNKKHIRNLREDYLFEESSQSAINRLKNNTLSLESDYLVNDSITLFDSKSDTQIKKTQLIMSELKADNLEMLIKLNNKKELRKMKNREAAVKSRLNKKMKFESVYELNQSLDDENKNIKNLLNEVINDSYKLCNNCRMLINQNKLKIQLQSFNEFQTYKCKYDTSTIRENDGEKSSGKPIRQQNKKIRVIDLQQQSNLGTKKFGLATSFIVLLVLLMTIINSTSKFDYESDSSYNTALITNNEKNIYSSNALTKNNDMNYITVPYRYLAFSLLSNNIDKLENSSDIENHNENSYEISNITYTNSTNKNVEFFNSILDTFINSNYKIKLLEPVQNINLLPDILDNYLDNNKKEVSIIEKSNSSDSNINNSLFDDLNNKNLFNAVKENPLIIESNNNSEKCLNISTIQTFQNFTIVDFHNYKTHKPNTLYELIDKNSKQTKLLSQENRNISNLITNKEEIKDKNKKENFYDLFFTSPKANLNNKIYSQMNPTQGNIGDKSPKFMQNLKENDKSHPEKSFLYNIPEVSYINANMNNGNLKIFKHHKNNLQNINSINNLKGIYDKDGNYASNYLNYTFIMKNYTNNDSCINNYSFLKFLENSRLNRLDKKYHNSSYMNEIKNIDDISDYYTKNLNLSSEEKLTIKNCIVMQIINSSTTTLNLGDIGKIKQKNYASKEIFTIKDEVYLKIVISAENIYDNIKSNLNDFKLSNFTVLDSIIKRDIFNNFKTTDNKKLYFVIKCQIKDLKILNYSA